MPTHLPHSNQFLSSMHLPFSANLPSQYNTTFLFYNRAWSTIHLEEVFGVGDHYTTPTWFLQFPSVGMSHTHFSLSARSRQREVLGWNHTGFTCYSGFSLLHFPPVLEDFWTWTLESIQFPALPIPSCVTPWKLNTPSFNCVINKMQKIIALAIYVSVRINHAKKVLRSTCWYRWSRKLWAMVGSCRVGEENIMALILGSLDTVTESDYSAVLRRRTSVCTMDSDANKNKPSEQVRLALRQVLVCMLWSCCTSLEYADGFTSSAWRVMITSPVLNLAQLKKKKKKAMKPTCGPCTQHPSVILRKTLLY